MAATNDGASLAHLADGMATLSARVAEQGEVQRNILTVLNALLETSRAQSEMLADILAAASQEADRRRSPKPSRLSPPRSAGWRRPRQA